MSVTVTPVDPQRPVSPRTLGPEGDLRRELFLPAGQYRVVINDARADWLPNRGFASQAIPARTETIDLRAGETREYPIKRDLADLHVSVPCETVLHSGIGSPSVWRSA